MFTEGQEESHDTCGLATQNIPSLFQSHVHKADFRFGVFFGHISSFRYNEHTPQCKQAKRNISIAVLIISASLFANLQKY
jgi:hypothetical protein